jgi:hypothetical protein
MIFIDTDPGSEAALLMYLPFLRDDAYVVLDDYVSEIAVEKAQLLRSFVDRAVAAGALEQHGVVPWGTWYGRLADRSKLADMPAPLPCWRELGHCWLVFVGHGDLADDALSMNGPVRFLEDGSELAGHALHEEIRNLGRGRFSHWGEHIYFAATDNSDPRTNGRAYSLVVHGEETPLNRALPFPRV